MGIVIALHVALLLMLRAMHGPEPVAAASGTLSVMSLDAPQQAQAQPPPPPTMPSKRVDQSVPLPSYVYSKTFDRDGKPTAPGNCATLDTVVQTLLADQKAVDSVLNLPRDARSVADAVVIWNAGWSNSASAVDAPLASARTSVEHSLTLLPERCLDEPIVGPRLVPVPAGSGTMFLVFGSGVWTWRELIAPPVPDTVLEDTNFDLEVMLQRLFGNEERD